ncbi:hypothetical protein G7062_08000 [Erysipelothrix sp. HDW6C]|uniref:hypothetical protein n=1 Tax=Erysipelothrix sp. HDW6C TaxID=2714930 RepID=UPI001407AF27|nr:hypothetical protein [Erysipelothrix sp. HDW6C]QIK70236.1 hypothetical protein G7062_08000 [Erysipelothrix sp. HDW6C]
MAKNTKVDDITKYGLIKDKRRRIIWVIKGTNEGYHIPEKDMKSIPILDGKYMWALLIFVLSTGLLKWPLLVSVGLAALVYGAFELYTRFVFLKKKQILKISADDMEKTRNEDALNAQRADYFLALMLPMLMMLILISRQIEPNGGFVGYEFYLFIALMIVAGAIVIYNGYHWYRLGKDIKKLENKK